ncbi:hypothetical protein AJ78_01168 [Emergomyces pasteurianus Ep9510]|uniref:Uncharacterized protein n=1 Tax=Emergomyces pasteurianus Ep9510 TaxID=1447872 RepID=A0A1J9QF75_9EURO|nr:hypothetical protein AJ78_01168 [Emergomyces pasteurianus Ep9510]
MARSAFATFTSFESQRSSPAHVGVRENEREQQQQQQQHQQQQNYRYHPISPTANNNSNNPTAFPSPTLTNPDMILPYDIERESSTPSPPFRPLQLPSPEHPGYRRSSAQMDNGLQVSSAGIGVALSPTTSASHNYQQRNPPPRNNWVFAGHEIRPPLSDIGEEDSPTRSRWDGDDEDMEVNEMVLDSALLLRPQRRNRNSNNNNEMLGNGVNRDAEGDHDDCSATEEDTVSCSASSSTISAPSEILDKWEEFRTDNGNTPNGTHREVATEERNQRRSQENERVSQDIAGAESVSDNSSIRAIMEEAGVDSEIDEEIDDGMSSAMLSKEAERILENAKKRLTHMEGNLSRARTSFRMTPSPSLLMGTAPLSHRQSTGNMGRSHSTTERRAQTSLAGALMRQRVSQDLSANSSHSRGLSDISIQSAQNNIANRSFRSFSALGSTNASGFGANDTSPSNDRFEPQAAYKSPVSTFNYIPEDPSEPDSNNVSQSDSPHSKRGLLPAQQDNNLENTPPGSTNRAPKISSVEEFNATYPARIPSRSQSQLQVRGLQDQMQDLKSKISTLKVQAQEDNLRRRSLHTLRTPSPFTAADQWYTTAGEYVGAQGQDADGVRNNQNNERDMGEDTEQLPQAPINNTDPSPAPVVIENHKPPIISDTDRPDDQKSIVASLYEDADENFAYDNADDIDRVALAEILNEPLDSPVSSDGGIYEDFPPMPAVSESTRHEDREDAFDYENFFLHSALGNYSREKANQRRQSFSSTGSVETTRPGSQATVYLDSSPRGRQGHIRNHSADTISTTASFETATEGAEYDGYDEDSDEIEKALYGSMNGDGMKYFRDLQFSQQYKNPRMGSRQQTRETIIATNGSASPAPLSTASTPRATGKKSSYSNSKGSSYHRTHSRQCSNDASSQIREAAAHLRSPTVMISSLISAGATQYYTPEPENAPVVLDAQLGQDDTKLMEGLLQSLGKVALLLQLSSNGGKRSSADERSSTLFRRRLDAARRVLEGQLDV